MSKINETSMVKQSGEGAAVNQSVVTQTSATNETGENAGKHGVEKVTLKNYAVRTANMPSLIWEPTEKNLKANGMLRHRLEEDNTIFPDDQPLDDESIEYLLASAWNDTKLKPGSQERENMLAVQRAIGYEFANERLLLQAFTRRSFNTDPWLRGANYEVLELVGDSLMSAAVFKVILRQHARFLHRDDEGKLYFCDYDEGDVSRIRQKYTSKDYLANRCYELGFDKFIRYGKDDDQSLPGPREDIMEAIVAAVAVDSDWDMEAVESVVETMLDIHLAFDPWDAERDKFDVLNSWWQKKFGAIPEYKVRRSDETDQQGRALYECDLALNLPLLDKDRDWDAWIEQAAEKWFVPTHERTGDNVVFHSSRISKSEARSMCADAGLKYIKAAGLFMNLKDCGFEPRLEDSVNQLQILSQRGYIGEVKYEFADYDDCWECTCRVDSFWDGVDGMTKKESKKKAAFAVLIQIFRSAGINDDAWDKVFEVEG